MDVQVNQGLMKGETVAVGQAELIAAEKTAAGVGKKVGELIPQPAVRVTEKGVAEMLLDARYKTAKNTIDKMVDTPEERRAKERRRLEEEAAEKRQEETELRAERNAALRREDPRSVSYV